MEKNKQYIGLFLILLILLVYQWLYPPMPKTPALQEPIKETTVVMPLEASSILPAQNNTTEHEEKKIFLENDFLRLQFSSKGGQIENVVLKTEKQYVHSKETEGFWPLHADKNTFPPIVFFDEKSKINFEYLSPDQSVQYTTDLYFEAIQDSNSPKIDFIWTDKNGGQLIFTYTLIDKEVKFSFQMKNLQQTILPNSWQWNLAIIPPAKEKSNVLDRNASTIFYKTIGEKRDYLSETADDQKTIKANLDWIAFKTLYYSMILIPNKPLAINANLSVKNPISDTDVKFYQANMSFDHPNTYDYQESFSIYFGSNEFKALKKLGHGIDEIVNFGWGIVRYINEYFMIYVFSFFIENNISVALALLLLTLMMKLILFPLYQKSYTSSAKMRLLKPELEELNKKFPKKEDAFKKQQAQLEIYRQTGVNPMAGCIPLIIQMPILFALFRFFPNLYELRLQSFLWADDLSAYDSIYSFNYNIPIYGSHVSLFTILFAISMVFYSKMNASNMTQPTQEGMPDMRIMLYFLPIFSILFFNNYAAGLSLYYFIANIISIAQTLLFRYIVDEKALRAKIDINKKKPLMKSKFQQKLEEIQKKK